MIEQLIQALERLVANLRAKYPVPPIVPIDETIPPPAPVTVPHVSLIPAWASAIQVQEGWTPVSRSFINRNPGNLKWTTLTESLGATGKDLNNFCVFPTVSAGLSALEKFLQMACTDQLKAFTSDMSLLSFTQVYAEPPNNNYALGVANALKVEVMTPIKNLL